MKKQNKTVSPISAINPLTVYRTAQLCKLLGISRVTLWRMVQAGELPPPIKITGNINGWLVTDIAAWQQTLHAVAYEAK